MTEQTPAYAIAYLRDVDVNEQIVEYIERIDATLAPYGGRFLVHGGALTPAEGAWDGDVVIIRFPDAGAARAWYDSADYQAILPLRLDNSRSIACLVEGVPNGYRAVDKLAVLLGRDEAFDITA
jgi:uncharacterized protein (DUF1330 family)